MPKIYIVIAQYVYDGFSDIETRSYVVSGKETISAAVSDVMLMRDGDWLLNTSVTATEYIFTNQEDIVRVY